MRTSLIIIVCSFLFSISCNIKSKAKTETNKDEILVSGGKFSAYKSVTIDNCKFQLVKKNNDTIYLTTNDLSFATPEGYKIGMEYQELPHNLQNKLQNEQGWGYYILLDSKWNIGFCEGQSCTDVKPGANSKIKWIFKRK